MREVQILQESFQRLPSFSAIVCPFQDPKFVRSRREGVSDLLDENGVNGRRIRNHSGREECTMPMLDHQVVEMEQSYW